VCSKSFIGCVVFLCFCLVVFVSISIFLFALSFVINKTHTNNVGSFLILFYDVVYIGVVLFLCREMLFMYVFVICCVIVSLFVICGFIFVFDFC